MKPNLNLLLYRDQKMRRFPIFTLLFLALSLWFSPLFAQDLDGLHLSTQRYPVRNGSPYPRSIYLNTLQTQAIGSLSREGRDFCTATVIANDAIITARHCFDPPPDSYDPFFPYLTGTEAFEIREGGSLSSLRVL